MCISCPTSVSLGIDIDFDTLLVAFYYFVICDKTIFRLLHKEISSPFGIVSRCSFAKNGIP